MRLTRLKRKQLRFKKKVTKVLLFGLIFLTLLSLGIEGTMALYTITGPASSVGFTVVDFNSVIGILPGTADPANTLNDEVYVYGETDGQLFLDFGRMETGSEADFPDVFQLINRWQTEKSVDIAVYIEGDLQAIITPPPDFVLGQDEEKGVGFNVSVPDNTAPGEYSGEIIIKGLGDFLQKKIPAKLAVVLGSGGGSTGVNTDDPANLTGTVDNAIQALTGGIGAPSGGTEGVVSGDTEGAVTGDTEGTGSDGSGRTAPADTGDTTSGNTGSDDTTPADNGDTTTVPESGGDGTQSLSN